MTFFKIIFILKLILIRGVGAIIYSIAALAFIPAKNFSDIVFVLPILEFFSGMLFPVLRTAIISKRVSSGVAFISSVVIGLCILIYLVFYLNSKANLIAYSLFSICLMPFALCASAELERRDINKSLNVEAKSATLSALMASILIYLGISFYLFEFLSSPLLRGALYPLIFLLAMDSRMLRVCIKFESKNIDYRLLFSLRGVDYLFFISLIKSNMLALVRIMPFGVDLIKYVIISYDLISAFVAYFLRGQHADAKFNSIVYLKKTKSFFILLVVISLLLCLLGLLLGGSYLSTCLYSASFVILFLAMSGATTTVIIGGSFCYISTLISLIFGLVYFDVNSSYIICVLFYNFVIVMLVVQYCRLKVKKM